MMPFRPWLLAALVLAATPAHAQFGPWLLNDPWLPEPHWAETTDELILSPRADERGSSATAQTFWWDSSGRIRMSRGDATPQTVIGYRILAMSISATDPALNGNWWDTGLMLAQRFGRDDATWHLDLLGGAGSANDNHWRNGDAWYYQGGLNVAIALPDHAQLDWGVLYDQDRVLWPDIPLPHISYTRAWGERFTATLGLPTTKFVARPWAGGSVQFRYDFPTDAMARLEQELIPRLSLYVQYGRSVDGFAVEGLDDHRRFYEFDRVSGGIRWVTKWADVSLGAGYGFDQKFYDGWDIRDTTTVARLDNGPFLHLLVKGTF
jgi:hypothetical protein